MKFYLFLLLSLFFSLVSSKCSLERQKDDRCSGKKLGPQNSFHNCKNRDGKCCSKNKDGSGGLDVKDGMGREDCGFCFTGKCKGDIPNYYCRNDIDCLEKCLLPGICYCYNGKCNNF